MVLLGSSTHVGARWKTKRDGERSRLHGPEVGVTWTARAALAAVQNVLASHISAGFQTPARVYGADFVLEGEGVTREDLI